ncbi:cobW-domain-containing protein [Dendrothele bispora CBS 962.96]|uniref:CobW-domain-containing protein n=1 Tax=Dendrothele bispora (strain CBS 962.96) TaxID=1314807 RepID=A0A4S8MK29_DENBC|nr:cobW-domain-containing protein [Dendrothele bispora CBS 962.96]
MPPIPITVFTGFLGAGKTTTILSLLPQLPEDYKVVLLKNEFGDIQVDSQLAKQSSLTAVSEILNGCMCCVLVGQMQNALIEIRGKYCPDRIIIECSGSAFPATLAFQIRELEKTTNGDFRLDAIVTVIDAENFAGYEDTSPTARMQASYTDVLLINKWETISERQLDIVYDHLNTLNDLTPKIRCNGRGGVDPQVIFGLESKLFTKDNYPVDHTHNDEVQTFSVLLHGRKSIEQKTIITALDSLKESVWRVKGFLNLKDGESTGVYILNWAFGRYELTRADHLEFSEKSIELTVMGERGEVRRGIAAFCRHLDATVV